MTYQSPRSTEAFRQTTAEHEKSPTNAVSGFFSFKCPECKEFRSTKGRKSRGYKRGFRCARCAEKMAVKYG